jgi:hypothetical protein
MQGRANEVVKSVGKGSWWVERVGSWGVDKFLYLALTQSLPYILGIRT